MNNKPELPEILASEICAKSRLFAIEQVKLRFSNGVERDYERMKGSGRGAVMVVPMLDDDTMLLIREYCCGTHNYELGFPKGLIDPGETPIEAANRELKEEIGYGAKHFVALKSLAMAPTYFGSSMNVFLATDLYQEKLEGDEPEPLEVIAWPLANSEQLLLDKDFNDARSVAALLLAKQCLATTKS